MRRSTLVMGVGIFLTAVVLYAWVLSARGACVAYLLPEWASTASGDFRTMLTFNIDPGSVVFSHSKTDNKWPMFTNYFGAGHRSYGEREFPSGEESFPSWSEIAAGRFARDIYKGEYFDEPSYSVPLWAVVAAVVGGTAVAVRVLRGKEKAMIAEGRVS